MAYFTEKQLDSMGFKFLGSNVKISIKTSLYEPERMEIGSNSRIDDFCILSGKLKLGRNVHITPMCLLAGGEVGIELSDFSALAYRVSVFTQSDDYSGNYMTNPTVPSQYTKFTARKILIGKHVIVGAHSVIFPGSKIADGVAVGAGSYVSGYLKEWNIYSGNPAIFLRERKQDLLILEKEYLKSELNTDD